MSVNISNVDMFHDNKVIEALTNNYVASLNQVLKTLDTQLVQRLVVRMLALKKENNTLFICGNGGSAANAIHLANDFTFGIHPKGNALNVEALAANSSILTCIGNDIGYEHIFSHQLKVKARSGDMLIVLSGSGNSANIVEVLAHAKQKGIDSVAIVGYDGGKAKALADMVFHFDINDMQISEDTQVVLGHILMKALNKELQDE